MATTILPTSIESLATASYCLFDEVNEHPEQSAMPLGSVQPYITTAMLAQPQQRRSPVNRFSTPSSRWSALTNRDPDASNAFIYAVRTTKIYCRPDCRARLARRANITFYDTALQAEADGFRACKRCKPDRSSNFSITNLASKNVDAVEGLLADTAVDSAKEVEEQLTDPDDVRTKIQHAVRLVRQSAIQGSPLSLSQLSKEVGLSKWHLQRVFKRLQGVTPREMAEAVQSSENGRKIQVASVGDSIFVEGGSENIHFGVEPYEFDVNGVTSMPQPPTSMLSTPSTEDALTPVPVTWSEDAYYDPMLFMAEENQSLEFDVEELLNDLFPELCSGNMVNADVGKGDSRYL